MEVGDKTLIYTRRNWSYSTDSHTKLPGFFLDQSRAATRKNRR
jgi:hypothetical protein